MPDPSDAAGEAAPDAQPRRLLQLAAAAPDIGTAPDLGARVDAQVTQPLPANPAELPAAAADPEQINDPAG